MSMKTYYTKCGREFNKSTEADTTGYHISEDGAGEITDEDCRDCVFVVDVTEGYPKPIHKRFECRAGCQSPNHENSYSGSADDKCTLRVYSLDNNFCEAVIEFARNHADLSAAYNQDCADCRRTVSVSCDQNRKGMAAKWELINKFFPNVESVADPTIDPDDLAAMAETQAPDNRQETAKDETEQYKPKCPFLRTIGEKYISCGTPDCRNLGRLDFKTVPECWDKTDLHCFGRFCDCENYREYYADPQSAKPDYAKCIYCCNNTHYTGLPEGYNGQEYCFCQLKQLPMKHNDSCEWLNRHPDWKLETKEDPPMEQSETIKSTPAEHTRGQRFALLKDAALYGDVLTPAFDYSELDDKTRDTLRQVESEIAKVRIQTVYDIGQYLKLAHDALANNKNGTFGVWVESIGFSRDSADNYLRAYDFICRNFGNIDDAANIQPSLLFAASKPSAPAELVKAVVDGDITQHKDYKDALSRLQEAEENAAGWRKALDAQKELAHDYRRELGKNADKQKALEYEINFAKQQLEQAKKNANPEKIKELTGILQEKNNEIDRLQWQLKSKPVETPAVEIHDVIPESFKKAWCNGIENAMNLLSGLSIDDINLLVRTVGIENYHYMKGTLRMNALNAQDNLKRLAEAIVKAPAPAAEFVRWAKEE